MGKDNRADIEIEYYKDISECAEDFNVGELDGFVSADNIVSSYSGITPVEIIGKEPYYLAVANDRSDLVPYTFSDMVRDHIPVVVCIVTAMLACAIFLVWRRY